MQFTNPKKHQGTMNRRFILSLLVMAAVAAGAMAQDMAVSLKDAYTKHSYIIGTDTLPYRELAPENPSSEQYPLVIFLHGAGERGTDNEAQLTHGAQMFLNPINRKKYPAYVLFPQCPPNGFWAYDEQPDLSSPKDFPILNEPTKWIKLVRGLATKYIKEGNVDPTRVYIVGLSMGGMAVYDLAERYPEMWASAVAICGAINPQRINKASGVKFRIYHGDADKVVPVEASRLAYLKLKKLGGSVEYFEFPGCTHGSWNPAFNQPDFLKWIFSNRRSTAK